MLSLNKIRNAMPVVEACDCCSDNFFKKMTHLESPKKNNDCYFYYYSTCSKGDSCGFRHEPSALGCETVCSFWKEGKCVNVHCNFRHMELRKNRKAIQCYWETQPGGCLKPHCPFMHKLPREVPSVSEKTGQNEKIFSEKYNETEPFKSNPSVDSLVVNFEEESDNESISPSPDKFNTSIHEKTMDEIRLEKIQEACAAYYSYPVESNLMPSQDDLRQRIWSRLQSSSTLQAMETELEQELEEISWKRKLHLSEDKSRFKRQKVAREINPSEIKIKTLAEIRAEKQQAQEQISLQGNAITPQQEKQTDEDEVSSTCPDEDSPPKILKQFVIKPVRKLNLKKIKSSCTSENAVSSNQVESNKMRIEDSHREESSCEEIKNNDDKVIKTKEHQTDEMEKETRDEIEKTVHESSRVTLDENLLLDDNDGSSENVTLKTEDDLLNEIDDLLND